MRVEAGWQARPPGKVSPAWERLAECWRLAAELLVREPGLRAAPVGWMEAPPEARWLVLAVLAEWLRAREVVDWWWVAEGWEAWMRRVPAERVVQGKQEGWPARAWLRVGCVGLPVSLRAAAWAAAWADCRSRAGLSAAESRPGAKASRRRCYPVG